MSKIHLLDKHVAELIAAGEVVERPSSVVKELVENAIDAGATTITVDIKNGGISSIRVADNGYGMDRDDVPTAFLRHATSKISTGEDLNAIGTLGFRGEALASIAAVSQIELVTRTREELAGIRYLISGGEEQSLEETGCPAGTFITVRDLFYNTPARMKFLKKDRSEANAVAGLLDRIALSHPEIAIRFIRDGKEALQTPGDGKLLSAIHAVYGKEFVAGMIPVEYSLNDMNVTGYISKPVHARPNRNMQNFYINGRYIKSRTMMAALEQAYKNSIMSGKFPSCVLNMTIPPDRIDINVHPSKLEVRFDNERPVFEVIYYGAKTALQKGDTRPQMELEQAHKPVKEPVFQPIQPQKQISVADLAPAADTTSAPATQIGVKKTSGTYAADNLPIQSVSAFPKSLYRTEGTDAFDIDIMVDDEVSPDTTVKAGLQDESKSPAAEKVKEAEFTVPMAAGDIMEPYRFIGEAFQTYVIFEIRDELLFIDKHAAHERLLFEQLKSETKPHSQMLLPPVTVTLSKEEYDQVLDNLETMRSTGFEIEDFGGGTVIVRAVPTELEGCDIPAAVTEIAGGFLEHGKEPVTEKQDWLYHSVACRAAVKAGNKSTHDELVQLAEEILSGSGVHYCPHGRPVAFRLTKKEIEKQFRRI